MIVPRLFCLLRSAQCFKEYSGSGDGFTFVEARNTFAVQAKYVAGGEVLCESGVETVNINTSFFARIIAFFRSLFHKLPEVNQ